MRYTFFNGGTRTEFRPTRVARDRWGQEVLKPDGTKMTMLEFYVEMVETSERRDVYILDDKGREVTIQKLQKVA